LYLKCSLQREKEGGDIKCTVKLLAFWEEEEEEEEESLSRRAESW
jgi:hypothetical protein